MGDSRDATTWVALELTRQGEQAAEDGTLDGDLRGALKVDEEWPIFIPAKTYSKSGKKVTVHLMEGYAFVGSGLDEVKYFKLEQEKKLVAKVMTDAAPSGVRVLSTINNKQVKALRSQLLERIASDIIPGMEVDITDGKYRGLEGKVLYIEDDYAQVHIELRSLQVLTRIPRVFLEAKLQEEDS